MQRHTIVLGPNLSEEPQELLREWNRLQRKHGFFSMAAPVQYPSGTAWDVYDAEKNHLCVIVMQEEISFEQASKAFAWDTLDTMKETMRKSGLPMYCYKMVCE